MATDPRPHNPFLGDSPPNVTDALGFILARVIKSGDPHEAYGKEFIRALAVASGTDVRDASRKLKERFQKDFIVSQWNADIRDCRNEMRSETPTAFLTSENGVPRACLANAIIALRESPLKLSFDEFSCRIIHQASSPWGTNGDFSDLDAAQATNYLQHKGIMVQSPTVREAALVVSSENSIHPPKDWLNSLIWDHKGRLDRWMTDHLGAPDTELQWTLSAAWTISAVGRIMRPGCIAKQMIVLEGPQNKGKSLALRALTNGHLDGDTGVQWFRDRMPDVDHKDAGLFMQGVWVIEVAELDAVRGKEWSRVKAFLSSPTDSFRAPFGHYLKDYPRHCIFAGSTNEYQWGGDPSGLTRFWPFLVGKIHVDAILHDREQIWAEAVHRYNAGERWRLSEEMEALAEQEQSERAPDDTLGERISIAARKLSLLGADDFSLSELMDKMNIATERQKAEQYSIGRALPSMGWTRFRPSIDGARTWRYRRNHGTE